MVFIIARLLSFFSLNTHRHTGTGIAGDSVRRRWSSSRQGLGEPVLLWLWHLLLCLLTFPLYACNYGSINSD